MPRHTHPSKINKHSRAHIRAERARYIEKRFRRAKNDGTCDHVNFWLRYRYRLSEEAQARQKQSHQETLQELRTLLLKHGYNYALLFHPYGTSYVDNIHPDVLRFIPKAMRENLSVSALPHPLGGLSKRDTFYRYNCDCSWCSPHAEDGWRRHEKNIWQSEANEEELDWREDSAREEGSQGV